MSTFGALAIIVGVILCFALFKPVTAILVNLIFYVFKIPTGREPGAQLAAAGSAGNVAADKAGRCKLDPS